MNTFRKILVAAAVTCAATQAQAQIYVAGSSAGCFGAGCTPGSYASVSGGGASLLEFNGSLLFEGTTVGGSKTFADPASTFNLQNFGSFSLSDDDGAYVDVPFLLQLSFSSPALGAASFTSEISGVVSGGAGSLTISFDPAGEATVLAGPLFNLSVDVDDLTVVDHVPAAISGTVYATTSAVPEPASVALVATGLLGLVGVARRRRTA